MPDDEVTSRGDAGDESRQLPNQPEASADQGSAGVEGSSSPASSSHTSGPEELEEDESSGEQDAAEGSSVSSSGKRVLPDMSPEAFNERMLALERSRDAKRNEETRPPDGEIVTFKSITVADVYVGLEADSLTTSLGRIEWKNFDEPIAEVIAEARRGDLYYCSQFVLVSNPTPGMALRKYGKIGLPVGFERIHGQLYVLGPSIVALVLTFVLTDPEAGRLDAELRRDAESNITTSGSGRNDVQTVYQAKLERVRGLRDELGKRCLDWLKEKFSGTLTAGSAPGVPICSLVSLTEGTPFHTQAEYMRLLDLTNGLLGSKFARPDYFYLTQPIGRQRRQEYIAAFNEADALAPGTYPDLSVTPEIFHQEISPFMVTRGLIGVFRSFESRMRGIRSDLEKVDFDGTTGSLTLVARLRIWLHLDRATEPPVVGIRNRLLGISRDIAIVCGDVIVLTDEVVSFWADYPLLISVNSNQGSPLSGESTADVTRRDLRALMTSLETQETGLRELVVVTSQAASDVQNTKTQKKLNGLTIALVALTVALVFIGIIQLVDPPTAGSNPAIAPHASTPTTRAPLRPAPSPTASKKSTRKPVA